MMIKMTEKATPHIPVFLCLIDEKDRVYLQRRYDTDFLNGYYEPPAGGLHENEFPQEAACREAREEAGVEVDPADIELFQAFLNFNPEAGPYLGLFFRTRKWSGTPSIMEPKLCDKADFFALNQLPDKMIPQARDALENVLTAPAITLSNYESITGRLEEQGFNVASDVKVGERIKKNEINP